MVKTGRPSPKANRKAELTLTVDDSGRLLLPQAVRDRLGVTPNDVIPATLTGSVLQINPKPSSKLETATAGRDSWDTPTDAGETLFGPTDR